MCFREASLLLVLQLSSSLVSRLVYLAKARIFGRKTHNTGARFFMHPCEHWVAALSLANVVASALAFGKPTLRAYR